jgi:hypothetical protein
VTPHSERNGVVWPIVVEVSCRWFFDAIDRPYVEARPLRNARPASIPVCLPLSTTTWPLTIT